MDSDSWDLSCLRDAIASVRLQKPDLTAREVHEKLVAQPRWEQVQLNAVKKMCGKMTKAAASGSKEPGAEHEHSCANPGCSNSAKAKCAACSLTWYCSRECQKSHYKEHKPACRAARIKARTSVLEAEEHLIKLIADGDCSQTSIVQNVRNVCGGGQGVDQSLIGVIMKFSEAATGRMDSFEQLRMIADGDERFLRKLKVVDGYKVRPVAQYAFGKLLNDDKGMSRLGRHRDKDKALSYLFEAADAGMAYAMCLIGNIIEDFQHGEEEKPGTARLYDAGEVPTVAGDTSAALVWWARAARTAAIPEALFNTGVAYGLGVGGTQKDLKRAAHCYELAISCKLHPDAPGSLESLIQVMGPLDGPQSTSQERARNNLMAVHREITIAEAQALAAARAGELDGKRPKPRGVRLPDDLPPLFPGPAHWVVDNRKMTIEMFSRSFSLPIPTLEMFLSSYTNQRDKDYRMRHLNFLYVDMRDKKMPLSSHCEFYETAGWDIKSALAKRCPEHVCTKHEAEELAGWSGRGMAMTDTYRAPRAIPGKCDLCDRPCMMECYCGESYCDRDCQAAHWPMHRKICQQVCEQEILGLKCNLVWWGADALQAGPAWRPDYDYEVEEE